MSSKCNLNIKFIASALGVSKAKARSTIVFLESEGYIKRVPVKDENGHMKGWQYFVYPEQLPVDERSNAGKKSEVSVSRVVGSPCCQKSDKSENDKDIYKENINNNKDFNKDNKEKTLLTESEKGADAPTHNDNGIDDKKLRERLSHKYNKDKPITDIEVKFYLGMEEKYPRIMRMDVPLKYSQYQQLLKDGVSNKKIIANLESMENWKPLNSKRVDAYKTLLNFIKLDKNEYPQEIA